MGIEKCLLPARAAAGGFRRSILVHAFQVRAHDVDQIQLNIADGGADGGGVARDAVADRRQAACIRPPQASGSERSCQRGDA